MNSLPPEPPGPPASSPAPSNPPRLLDRVRAAIRLRHYSPRTEDAYVGWVRRFILFHGVRHPAEMGAAEINRFLTDLAVNGHVSASTQNQAFSALLFVYQQALQVTGAAILVFRDSTSFAGGPGSLAERSGGARRSFRPTRAPIPLSLPLFVGSITHRGFLPGTDSEICHEDHTS
jgi:Phage integrase, N-terminal SAM-like domain